MWMSFAGPILGAAFAVLLVRLGATADRSADAARQAREAETIAELNRQLVELRDRAQEINAANSAQRTHDWAAGR